MERHENEVRRLHRIVEKRLSANAFLTGEECCVADIATFPWGTGAGERDINIAVCAAVLRWHEAIAMSLFARRGRALLTDRWRNGPVTEPMRETMSGTTRFTVRQGAQFL